MSRFKTQLRILLILALMLSALCIFCVCAQAESGTYRGVDWDLTDGVLTIGKAGETQTFEYKEYEYYTSWPWYVLKSSVTSVHFAGNVIGQGSLEEMFYNCTRLVSFDASGFDTSNVSNMGGMFEGCSGLSSLDVSGLNTSNVTDMSKMFASCSHLAFLDISALDTSMVRTLSDMFGHDPALKRVVLSPNFSFKGNTPFSGLWANLPSAYNVSSGRWIREDKAFGPYMSDELRDNYTSQMAGVWVWYADYYIVLYSNGDFVFQANDDIDVTRGDVLGIYGCNPDVVYTQSSQLPYTGLLSRVKRVVFDTNIKPVSTAYWFSGMSNLESIENIDRLDTSNVTSMSSMFQSCSKLISLDVSGFDTSKVTNMVNMFQSCSKLTSLDVSGFDTSKVTSMGSMFNNCSKLTSLDVSGFNTSKVANMDSMFSGCSGLTSLDVSGFNTSKVTGMWGMFSNCSGLTSLDVSGFNTSKATSLYDMFRYCRGLTSLDLSGFDTSSVTNMSCMFIFCSNLASLDISGFDTSKVTNMSNMFFNSPKLHEINVGENFSFKGKSIASIGNQAILPTPPSLSDGISYTGRWIRDDEAYGPFTSDELRDNYTSTMAGTWVWEEPIITLLFEKPVVDEDRYAGAMADKTCNPMSDIVLPMNLYYRFGYVFDHWVDENGNEYENKGVIPANRYSTGDTVVLTAVFIPFDRSVILEDGQFEFDLQGGATAEFDGVPGNTQYQIWEETPDGWQLVQEDNTSGSIPPERTAIVAYRNNYNPDLAQVTLVGQKKVIDSSGIALYPAENQYTFMLTETTGGSSVPLQEIKNSDGGIVRFDSIELNSVSTHTYEIREVAGSDSGMNYDDHVEIVTVQVTDNGSGLLTSEITTDSDGIVFTNYLNDRGSLKLTKIANDETGSFHWNEGETFSFNITFRDKYDFVPSGACSTYLSNEASNKGWTYDDATGVMTVVLNENKQSVVIENIPYGLRYSIQENLSDSGLYELTNVTGNMGVISETQSEAVFTNTFKIVPTSIMLMAYKTADFDIENDEFTFELLDSDMNVIQSVTNGSVVSDGMNGGKAPVLFDSIPVTSDGTFTYYIREVVGNDVGIEYDDQLIKCEVNVVNEHGYLRADVIYSLQD